MSIQIQECITCLTRYFPARLMCRTCSDSNFRSVEVDQSRVGQRTELADGTALATLHIGDAIRVIARVYPTVQPGDAVELHDHENLEPGQAYVPTRQRPQ